MNKFKITIDENNFDVTVNVTDHNRATVEVNGISYDVSYESKISCLRLLLAKQQRFQQRLNTMPQLNQMLPQTRVLV